VTVTQTKQAVWEAATVQYAPPLQIDLESGVRFTCDVGYLCANACCPLGPM